MANKHPADVDNNGVITPEERAAWVAANPGVSFSSGWSNTGGNGFKTPVGNTNTWSNPTIDPTAEAKRKALEAQAASASGFAGVGEQGYGAMTAEAAANRAALQRYASGQDSLSSEQLRQGLQQNLSAQRSMAASASPQNSAMASRTAAMQMGRSSAGMSGQAAMAGIAERQAAQKALNDAIMQQRQQDAQVALGSRQNAIGGYGGTTPQGSAADRWSGAVGSGLAAYTKMSDRRLKTEIEKADEDALASIAGMQAYTYEYKDEKHGKGRQLGVMAQDLEAAGLGHTVIETSQGKAVDGAALTTANTAMIAALGRRVAELEDRLAKAEGKHE